MRRTVLYEYEVDLHENEFGGGTPQGFVQGCAAWPLKPLPVSDEPKNDNLSRIGYKFANVDAGKKSSKPLVILVQNSSNPMLDSGAAHR